MFSDFVQDLQEEDTIASEMPSAQFIHSLPESRKNSQATSYDGSSTPTTIKSEKSHECPVCHKAFTRKAIFLDHFRSQHSDERILCSICSKPFKRQNDRRRHEKLHSGERAFQCQGGNEDSRVGCGKRFARLHSLKEHQRRKPGTTCYELLTGRRESQTSLPPSEPDSLSYSSDDEDDEMIVESIEDPIDIVSSPLEYDMDVPDAEDCKHAPVTPHVSIQPAHISWPSVMEAKIRHQVGRALAAAHQEPTKLENEIKGSVPPPTSKNLHHCWMCPSRYGTKESFEFHLKHHFYELDQRPYHCSQCGVNFSLMHHLSKHMPNCTGNFGFYRCNWGCGRQFTSKADVTRHSNSADGTGCFENVERYEQKMKHTILIGLKKLKES